MPSDGAEVIRQSSVAPCHPQMTDRVDRSDVGSHGNAIAAHRSMATATPGNTAVEVVVVRLEVGPEAVRASAALLSDEERQRADRFVLERDRRRLVLARARPRPRLVAAVST